MRHLSPYHHILALLMLIALAGCAQKPAAYDPAARLTSIAAAPTVTPRPWETVRPIPPTALPTPNLPTVTPFATPRPQGGIFADAALGFTITYPFYWNSSAAAVPGTLVQLANKPNDVFVLILRTVRDQDKTLEDDAGDVQSQVGDWMGGLDVVRTEGGATAAADPTWGGEYRREYAIYGVTISSQMISVANGKQLITMAAYGREEDVGKERETITQIFDSITLSEPEIYGVPRGQAYVYAAQEPADPQEADPAIGRGDRLAFSGLLRFAPDLSLQPDLAASWAISDDGRTYTFFLRRDARFQSGRPLIARDVLYSWERAASPELGSDSVLGSLGDIAGLRERRAGEAETISGLSAPDDYTVQVTLVGPQPDFLMKLAGGPALVVDQADVQRGAAWYRHPNGSGPYRLIRWEPGKVKIYERSEAYYGDPPATRYLVARLDVGYNGIYAYMLGELDQIGLSDVELAAIGDIDGSLAADLRESPQMCTSFVAFDTSRPPFDDPRVRQAFSLAVDRQRYQERVLRGTGILAHGLYPPAMPGYDPSFQGATFDPGLARQRLAESGYGGGDGLPAITLTSSGSGLAVDPGVGVLVQMWQEQLGARIKIEQLDPASYAASVRGDGRGNLFFSERCADYPDPSDFAETLFGSGSPQNLGRYHNADLDGLLAQAEVASDPAERVRRYQRAEALIVDDAAAIFLNHRVDAMLVSPAVRGLVRAPFPPAARPTGSSGRWCSPSACCSCLAPPPTRSSCCAGS
ncbi:ABC transporter substrate-binding protein [Oscillochloris sp. ZM17-4]|uniref:ABC transporter substrate-binding protein n=1 Tax=Oscillochloris sp. ZM17-4 TaxID=2866714 RepID=UPI001C72D52C|nr:ABC transporter substrate-binding protein [Oscillochloris sp. ZM17-4]MBX0330389.1 ABC transporter substrate-binding protein [Oscillochloris sp. ZM17-4]